MRDSSSILLSPLTGKITGKIQGRSITNQVLLIGFLCFHHRSSVEFNRFLTLHFSISTWKTFNNIYFIAQKVFLLDILEAVLAFIKIRFIKEKEVILNGNANDKSRGIQLIGPGCLQRVLKGVNWPLSPIAQVNTILSEVQWHYLCWVSTVVSVVHDQVEVIFTELHYVPIVVSHCWFFSPLFVFVFICNCYWSICVMKFQM